MRKLAVLLVLVVLAAGGAYVAAGYSVGPTIDVVSPTGFVGLFTPLDVVVEAPHGQVSSLDVALEQNGVRMALEPTQAPDGADRLRVTADLGPQALPDLETGPARLIVTASRPVLGGFRQVSTAVVQDVQIRHEPPRVSILSTHHYINLGGAEVVVYRVTPADAVSGVAVGDLEYPGYPASGVTVDGVRISDPSVRVAFFALLENQNLDTPIRLFARDPADNAAGSEFDHRTFNKRFRHSRIQLNDQFLDRVVPSILSATDEVSPDGDVIDQYVVINSELRRLNAERIASFAEQTAPEMLWQGVPFHAFGNNAVESGFADRRTYVYEGTDVDQQVHLGFDLASVAQAPIVAANRGRVLFAEELGIYGNCVIIDHGMGLQSLYGHLSTIDVQPGAMVELGQQIGRSGITGLAGGDHLHFAMLVNGRMVNPVEWWDPHWLEDRILRKFRAVQ